MVDTIIGAAIGVAFAWADIRLIRSRLRPGAPGG
jgi:uncharacterized membrane protein YccC